MAGVARGLETARARSGAEAGGGRRRAGFLGGFEEGLSGHPRAALLGPQDANVLDKLPKSRQGKAKQALHDIYLAEDRRTAEDELDSFKNLYEKKFPKAAGCLEKDREVLLAFYDFPAEHWVHLRTTNPIESTFATVRLRQRRTKGCGSREASLTMVFMLARQAERHWRRLNGSEVIVHVLEGKEFKDGLMVQENAA